MFSFLDKGAACLVKAKKAASDLVKLNEKYMGIGANYVATHTPKNKDQLSGWAYHMGEYYKHLKTEDATLKACTTMFAVIGKLFLYE